MNTRYLAPAVAFIATGVLLGIITVRCSDGRMKRNRFAGIRTRATMASDENWLTAHIAARPPMMRGAQALILSGVIILLKNIGPVLALLGLIFSLVSLFQGARAAVRATATPPTR